MVENLEPHVTAIGVQQHPDVAWKGRVPVVPIGVPGIRRRHQLAERLGLGKVAAPRRNRALERLRGLVDSETVDRVLVHYLTLAIRTEPVWAATKKRLFIYCHGYDVTWDLRDHEAPHRPAYRPSYVEAARRLSKTATFIANSQTTARRLESIGIPDDRVAVNYPGVPVPDTFPERPPRTEKLTVLFLGRLVDCKGPDRVISAFDLACRKGFKGRLQIAGDGPLRDRCRDLCEKSEYRPRIELLGAVDRESGRRLRHTADIFTAHSMRGPLTNQKEAYGVTFVEAMAQGLPIVSGRSGSLPELIDDGRDGILVTPDDIESHADALLRLEAAPEMRRRLGKAAWRKAGELYSQERERRRLPEILGLGVIDPAES
jgi:glycosyltransferase involved in cell wall biosynthesis